MPAGSFLATKILEAPTQAERLVLFSRTVNAGITAELMVDSQDERVWASLAQYVGMYGQTPSVEVLEHDTEIDLPIPPDDPIEYWIDEVLNQYLRARVIRAGNEMVEIAARGDVREAINCMREVYSESIQRVSRGQSIYWLDDVPRQLEEHREKQLGLAEIGILTGLPYVDAITLGIQAGDSWAIVGRPEVGKSYILSRYLLGMFGNNIRVTVYSMEMPKEQWARRATALASHISATLLRAGRLSMYAVERIQQYQQAEQVRSENYKIIEGRLNMTTSDVLLEIQQARPQLVAVDGAYLLHSAKRQRFGSRWERAMAVMEELRQISLQTGVPIIGTYQFGRGGERKGLEGIAGSDAIGQLNSIVQAIYNEVDPQLPRDHQHTDVGVIPLVTFKILEFIKGREGEKGKVRLRYDMRRTSIEQDRVLRGAADPIDVFLDGGDFVDDGFDTNLDEIF